jgi:glycosyltransferase involved in cell wall biosynthesis
LIPTEHSAARDSARTDRPRFSVVIPAVNEAVCIGECLSSLASQRYSGMVEVIVVDNNSSDATAAIASSFGATVVIERRRGVCWARQAGTAVARGEIVVSTDADTTFEPDWLSRIDDVFRREPAAVAVAGSCVFVVAPRWGSVYASLLFGLVHRLYRLTGRVFYVTDTNIAFRRSAWTGYATQLTQGGDELDLLRRLRAKGKVIFERGNPTYTSARRMRRGFLYNVFVTFIFYYLIGYSLNRLLGRPFLGTAPEIRCEAASRRSPRLLRVALAGIVIATVLMARFTDVDVA